MPLPPLPPDRAGRIRLLAHLALLKLALIAAIVAGVVGRPWLVVAALGVAALTELAADRWQPAIGEVLDLARLSPPARLGLAMIAVTALAARCCPTSVFEGAGLAGFVVVVAAGMQIGFGQVLLAARPTLDVTAIGEPPPSFDGLARTHGCLTSVVGLIAAFGVALTGRGHGVAPAAVGLALASAFALARAARVGALVVRTARPSARAARVSLATESIAALTPEVLVYFDATPGEIYQVRQWIEPVRRLGRSAAVVVRDPVVRDRLGVIDLPVICTPYNGTLATIPLPERVVALFVTHTGNNLAMIRRPGTRTVFVGHGDSDKPDSVNPFARVYDEVWVAGPLGRRRYDEASVDVRDGAIVEIGRPQVSGTGAPSDPPEIVYAPTWEGWGDDPHHSSLSHVGPALVAALTRASGVRVRYRPHPLTGNRNPALRRAHEQIVATPGVELVAADEPIERTFASASGLVADVSSVISEWLAFDRPYAVTDTRGLGADAFTSRFPSTAGGFVLGAGLSGLTEFVAAATGGADSTTNARRALVLDALGDPATSQERFAAAVERLLTT